MSPELSDFLTELYSVEAQILVMPSRMHWCARLFYRYLDAIGVEQCNFGGFCVDDKVGSGEAFSFSRMSPAFQDEFVGEFVAHDYPILKAQELTLNQPFAVFDVGRSHIEEARAYHAPSARVIDAVSGQGLVDAVALIGILPAGVVSGFQYFGFVFGGPVGTSSLIWSKLTEIQIASFALLEAGKGHVLGMLDGFKFDLTARERDVLAGIAEGQQRKQLAFKYNISIPTVDLHLGNLRRKLGATSLHDAVGRAYRYQLI